MRSADNWILNAVILYVLEHAVLHKWILLTLISRLASSTSDEAIEKHRVQEFKKHICGDISVIFSFLTVQVLKFLNRCIHGFLEEVEGF